MSADVGDGRFTRFRKITVTSHVVLVEAVVPLVRVGDQPIEGGIHVFGLGHEWRVIFGPREQKREFGLTGVKLVHDQG